MMWQVFKNIYFTKGYNRTLVYDSLKSEINFIPNDLYDFLDTNNFVFSKESIDFEYFNFLQGLEIIFQTNEHIKDLFIDPPTDTTIPYELAVAVIEVSNTTTEQLHKLLISDNDYCDLGQFNFIFSDYTTKRAIELLVEFINAYEVDVVELTILNGFKFVDQLFFEMKEINRTVIVNNFSSNNIEDNYSKLKNRMFGGVDIKSLKISADMVSYLDSEFHNLYFYNKIFIGANTEIKNSYETDEVFGYLDKLEKFDIKDIKKHKFFNKYWNIKKEDTLVCNGCEFRRLCSDNRLPISTNNGKWTHQKECDYNPYISKWTGEEGYKTLDETNVNIDSGEVIIDKNLLSEIVLELWEE